MKWYEKTLPAGNSCFSTDSAKDTENLRKICINKSVGMRKIPPKVIKPPTNILSIKLAMIVINNSFNE